MTISQSTDAVRCFCCGQLASDRADGPLAGAVAQTTRWTAMVIDVQPISDGGQWRAAVCCWPCFWSLDPGMWISEKMWSSKNPTVLFTKLPLLGDGQIDDPCAYPWPG